MFQKIRLASKQAIRCKRAFCPCILIAWLGQLCSPLSAQQNHIYLANDNHTDYFWSGNAQDYVGVALNEIDYYVAQADATANLASPYQSRYNLDGAWYAYTYKQHRTPEQFGQLISCMQSGHISLPYNFFVSTYGGQPTEAVLRGMYWPARLERDYGLNLTMAVAMENQTLPLGLSSLWAGSGVKYSWKGVCGCASPVASENLQNRTHQIYRYRGLDGNQVVMKWYSLSTGGNQKLGGYAEARNPSAAVAECEAKCNTTAYPYSIAGAFGHGWDDLQTLTDVFVQTAQGQSNANRQIYVSNEYDFFEHFLGTYDAGSLPVETLTYGNDWDMDCEALAPETEKVRRAVEKLRTAEAMASIVSLIDPDFYPAQDAQREAAWVALGSYWEHNFGLGGCCSGERGAWQRGLEQDISTYVDGLYDNALAALAGMIENPSSNQRFMVFNPLGWERPDYVDVAYAGGPGIKVVGLKTGQEAPFQLYTQQGVQYLRILASGVPSVGYEIYEIRQGAGAGFPDAATLQGHVFENALYRLTVTSQGVITSLVDKMNGNLELVREIDGRFVNDFGQGGNEGGTMALLHNGPVSATISCTSPNPLQHTTFITLYTDIDRIDIDNRIDDEFGNNIRTYSFSFDLDNPTLRHEELGAILKAKYAGNGGHYAAPGLPIRHDWQSLNHFADIGTDSRGIVLSNQGAGFMKLGNSSLNFLDENASQANVLIGGRMGGSGPGFENQDGLTSFRNSFALRTRQGAFDAASDMRFALEHQNRLVARMLDNQEGPLPNTFFSLLNMSAPDVLLWALKPAEEGITDGGLIVRMWNLSAQSQTNTASFSGEVSGAWKTTHLETDIGPAAINQGGLQATIGQQAMATFRLFVGLANSTHDNHQVIRPEPSIRLFPNPASESLSIEVPGVMGVVKLKVYDMAGNEAMSRTLESGHIKLDVSKLQPGVFLFVFEGKNRRLAQKVVIE
ncbi:MAG: T9SS type A sorting domain-containing protein [Lewinellaceae bacterium]|nr:T9SS type A sorting domain-containing protein [Lewinellaceae bacterium]